MPPMQNNKELKNCPVKYVLSINDALNVVSGKWKLPIIGLLFFGKKRFSVLQRSIPKITPRMLSKELKELELNGIVIRKVDEAAPVMVEYELSASGLLIKEVLDKMIEWGDRHRASVLGR
jgi:DNA-binding HxlR family transcriptional regulator